MAAERELAVVLVGAGAPAATEAVEANVSGGELLPATLVLRTGTTLRIRNSDEIGHELLAKGLDGFSAEASSPGAVRAVNLKQVGHWQIVDRLAAHAQAHLHVLPDVVAIAKVEARTAASRSTTSRPASTRSRFFGASARSRQSRSK